MAKLQVGKVRHWVAIAGGSAALAWVALDASAGQKYNTGVSVWYPTPTTKSAQGAIGAARNSADTIQSIGCKLTSVNGGSVSGYCYATDIASRYAGCSTTDYDLLEVIKALWESSFIQFSARADGSCDTITTFNDSYEQPKLP